MKNIFKKIKLFIYNAFRYRKELSDDYDFDYDFLIALIQKKLVFMSNYFKNGKCYSEKSNEKHKQIEKALKILEKYFSEETFIIKRAKYLNQFFNYVKKNIFFWSD